MLVYYICDIMPNCRSIVIHLHMICNCEQTILHFINLFARPHRNLFLLNIIGQIKGLVENDVVLNFSMVSLLIKVNY